MEPPVFDLPDAVDEHGGHHGRLGGREVGQHVGVRLVGRGASRGGRHAREGHVAPSRVICSEITLYQSISNIIASTGSVLKIPAFNVRRDAAVSAFVVNLPEADPGMAHAAHLLHHHLLFHEVVGPEECWS